MLILLTVCHTFHIFYLSLTDFQNFPGPGALFQDFPVLENATDKFQDFLGFPGPVRTLMNYFIYTPHHFTPHGKIRTQLIDLAPNVWHRTGIAEVTGSSPVEALIFSGFFFPIGKFTAMIILHFHLQPQFKYELFHIYFTS